MDGEQQTSSKPHHIVAGLIIFSFVAGFAGGIVGWKVMDESSGFPGGDTAGQQIILEENEVIANVAETVSPSVVSISVASTSEDIYFGEYVSESAGTGVIISDEGLVLTNKHVVSANAAELSVILNDGTEYSDVEVVGLDQFNDLAYLKINGAENLKPAILADSSSVRVGERVIAIGNALGQYDNTVTSGIISGIGRPVVAGDGFESETLQNLFQTDAAINPGNSGGPLVNIKGEVIGINTAVAEAAENIGFAIPINDAKAGIASVEENSELVQPYLGVRYISLTPEIANDLDLSLDKGAYLIADEGETAILPGSPADKGGLQDGDIIMEVGGTPVDDKHPLVNLVTQHKVGETITLKINRDGQELNLDVTLEQVPTSL